MGRHNRHFSGDSCVKNCNPSLQHGLIVQFVNIFNLWVPDRASLIIARDYENCHDFPPVTSHSLQVKEGYTFRLLGDSGDSWDTKCKLWMPDMHFMSVRGMAINDSVGTIAASSRFSSDAATLTVCLCVSPVYIYIWDNKNVIQLVNKMNSKKQHSAIFSIRAIPKVSSNDVKTTFKNKIFCSTQRFLARLHAVGGCTQHRSTSHDSFVRIKYFSKKIVKIENVNSFLENVSVEKKLPVEFRNLYTVTITILLMLRPIHQIQTNY